MKMNLSQMLFMAGIITGTLITISSTSWIMMWIGLEMNMLSFIPLMTNKKTPYESESSIKYFLVQAMASMMLLTTILLSGMMEMTKSVWYETIMITAMFTKMGAAPFHMWFPTVMQGISWFNCLTLMTWQKVAPMILMSYQLKESILMSMVVIMCVLTGSVGGMNQTSIKKMLAYSSISHIGWMIMSIMISDNYWIMYFIIYTMMNTTVIMVMNMYSMTQLTQIFSMKSDLSTKVMMFMTILSLGGLPPFLGFLPKWMVIQEMSNSKQMYLIMIMTMTTILTLFFYLRLMYSALTLMTQNNMWSKSEPNKSKMMMMTSISIMGIPILTMMNMF